MSIDTGLIDSKPISFQLEDFELFDFSSHPKVFNKPLNFFSKIFLKSLEKSIGLDKFNTEFYLPLKNFYRNNPGKLFDLAKKNSSYEFSEEESLLRSRLFVEAAYRQMQIDYEIEGDKSLNSYVPPEGVASIFIMNHPFGIVDTLISARLMMQVRPDIKFLANSLAGKFVPEIKDLLLEVDTSLEGKGQSRAVIQSASKYLKSGGMIIIFPDPVLPLRKPWYKSEVSAKQKYDFKRGLGQLIMAEPDTNILMGHLSGGKPNSLFYHSLGRIHPSVKVSTLLREFIRIKNTKTYKVKFSSVIEGGDILKTLGLDERPKYYDVKISKQNAYKISKCLEAEYKKDFYL